MVLSAEVNRMPKVILVVDDDADVRETAVNLVESLGYRVASATNATDAFRLVQNDRIDAVLTDLMMPGMNGFQLAQSIHALNPRMPVICVTGHADVVENPAHFAVLIQKPYRAATIAKALKSVLGA
jgi:DNA-binding NtrC family response regulator